MTIRATGPRFLVIIFSRKKAQTAQKKISYKPIVLEEILLARPLSNCFRAFLRKVFVPFAATRHKLHKRRSLINHRTSGNLFSPSAEQLLCAFCAFLWQSFCAFLWRLMKSFAAGKACGPAQVLFDAQQLIVLCRAIGARKRSGFDLSGVGGDSEIGDKRIFSLAGTMRDDRRAAVSLRELDAVQRFRERADLVDFDQNRISHTQVDSFLQKLSVGDEEIVADKLHALANLVS